MYQKTRLFFAAHRGGTETFVAEFDHGDELSDAELDDGIQLMLDACETDAEVGRVRRGVWIQYLPLN